MHDSLLLANLIKDLEDICRKNNINKINTIYITVDKESDIASHDLLEHLIEFDTMGVGNFTRIVLYKRDIEKDTLIIEQLEGES